jgi:branched-chain amino acid transport system permease protein
MMERKSPWVGLGLLAALIAVLLILPEFLERRPFELRLITVIFLYATLGHGWNVLGGFAGQASIGHGLFFGIGAYTSTLLVLRLDLSPWFGMAAGSGAAALAGVAIGIPCFHLRGHYFVIATLVVAEAVFQLFTAWDWVGAAAGLSLPLREAGLANFEFHRDKAPYYYIALIMLVIATTLVWWLKRSPMGLVLKGIRDDEEAVRSLGFSPSRYKLLAMAISAAMVGAGGVFYAQYVLFIDPFSVLHLSLSVIIALIPILGGVGAIAGPIVGAAILIPISEYSRVWFSGSGRNVDLLIYGLLIMVVAIFRPEGLMSLAGSRRLGVLLARLGLRRAGKNRPPGAPLQ